jgi:hypothetical protein
MADLHCTAGCHPTSTGELDKYPGGITAYLDALRNVIKEDREGEKRIISIGEIGLGAWFFFFLTSPPSVLSSSSPLLAYRDRRIVIPELFDPIWKSEADQRLRPTQIRPQRNPTTAFSPIARPIERVQSSALLAFQSA